jgi:hypothetical protein
MRAEIVLWFILDRCKREKDKEEREGDTLDGWSVRVEMEMVSIPFF